jgi:hypothetical protein
MRKHAGSDLAGLAARKKGQKVKGKREVRNSAGGFR